MGKTRWGVCATLRGVRFTAVAMLLFASLLTLDSIITVGAATVTANIFTDPTPGACATSGTGNCSLRETVIFANAHPGTSIVLLAGIYRLTIGYTGAIDGTTGALDLTGTMTLMGAGQASTIIDASGMTPLDDRALTVESGGNATLSGITIHGDSRGGYIGGGILSSGTLVLADSTVAASSAQTGGGIAITGGQATLDHVTIGGAGSDGNTATTGGGISVGQGQVTIRNNSQIVGNRAATGGGMSTSGTILMDTTTVMNNALVPPSCNCTGFVPYNGGGIYNAASGTLTITNSEVSHNSATLTTNSGGGIFNHGTITLTNVVIDNNAAAWFGGGLASMTVYTPWDMPVATLTNVTVRDNRANGGGGVVTDNMLTMHSSTVSHNTSELGGGMEVAGTTTIDASTISDNSAYEDGAILNESTTTITNSTINAEYCHQYQRHRHFRVTTPREQHRERERLDDWGRHRQQLRG